MAYDISEFLELRDEEIKLFRKRKIKAPKRKKTPRKAEIKVGPLYSQEKDKGADKSRKDKAAKTPSKSSKRDDGSPDESSGSSDDKKPKEKQTSLFQFS
jgi:replication factor C large subunit